MKFRLKSRIEPWRHISISRTSSSAYAGSPGFPYAVNHAETRIGDRYGEQKLGIWHCNGSCLCNDPLKEMHENCYDHGDFSGQTATQKSKRLVYQNTQNVKEAGYDHDYTIYSTSSCRAV